MVRETVYALTADAHIGRPPLVIVGGAPASGKTTLARRLAGALSLPLLTKDDIKEALFDALGPADMEQSRRLGRASYSVLYVVAARLLESGAGALLESNFERDGSEAHLRPLASAANAALIQCRTTNVEIVRRYAERDAGGERHPGHMGAAVIPRLLANLDAGLYEGLDLDIPTLIVDTTRGYTPEFAAIVDFLRAAATGSRATS